MLSYRVLVTGGAGFLGAHLCRRLHAEGHVVYCLDNLSTARPGSLDHLHGAERFVFLQADVRDPIDIEVDQIYNLACPASPVHYQRNPVQTLRTSVEGALRVLELAQRTRARVLQASTSEVYGDPEEHPQIETYRGAVSCTGPRACYDEGKRAAETLFADFRRSHGVDARIARIFNTYGPGMAFDDGRVVSSFVFQALRGDDLTLYGDGAQTRSFCYVQDLIEALMRLMSHADEAGPVNLGNPAEITVRELAQAVLALCGSASQTVQAPLPVDDPTRRRPDITRARQRLDWQPQVSLDEGLRKTIDDFRSRLAAGERVRD